MMLRIQFAFLALFVVVRARPEFGETTVELPVGSNISAGQCCSCSSDCTIRQIMTSISMLKFGSTPPPKPKRDDYEYTAGVGAHKLHTRAKVWYEARRICEEEGGHLAIINSQAEANVLKKLFEKSEAFRGTPHPDFAAIGFHDLYKDGEYVTIHGQSLERAGFTQWARGQPDNYGGKEDCGSIYKDGLLNDINCKDLLAFICELSDV